ncbi:MAG: hypothetical protein IPK27_07405 [Rhodanobacteraceae bacterium]|nr:hypothetical protein [Rhodanobacteraceae bacterium]
MAFTTIIFKNPHTGMMKTAPVGFSWTVFCFGPFPPLFRGDWKRAVIMFLLVFVTAGLSSVIFMFIYNKLYIKDLIEAGYKAQSIATGDLDYASMKIGMEIPRIAP